MICKILFLIFLSLVGAFLTQVIIDYLVKPYIKSKLPPKAPKDKNDLKELPRLAFFGGFLEILLYSGSFLIEKPEFILLWLGVKTALRWDRKRNEKEEYQEEYRKILYRGLYYSFLIGSAINIIFGYIIYRII
jgi:hypothetical protein